MPVLFINQKEILHSTIIIDNNITNIAIFLSGYCFIISIYYSIKVIKKSDLIVFYF